MFYIPRVNQSPSEQRKAHESSLWTHLDRGWRWWANGCAVSWMLGCSRSSSCSLAYFGNTSLYSLRAFFPISNGEAHESHQGLVTSSKSRSVEVLSTRVLTHWDVTLPSLFFPIISGGPNVLLILSWSNTDFLAFNNGALTTLYYILGDISPSTSSHLPFW